MPSRLFTANSYEKAVQIKTGKQTDDDRANRKTETGLVDIQRQLKLTYTDRVNIQIKTGQMKAETGLVDIQRQCKLTYTDRVNIQINTGRTERQRQG